MRMPLKHFSAHHTHIKGHMRLVMTLTFSNALLIRGLMRFSPSIGGLPAARACNTYGRDNSSNLERMASSLQS